MRRPVSDQRSLGLHENTSAFLLQAEVVLLLPRSHTYVNIERLAAKGTKHAPSRCSFVRWISRVMGMTTSSFVMEVAGYRHLPSPVQNLLKAPKRRTLERNEQSRPRKTRPPSVDARNGKLDGTSQWKSESFFRRSSNSRRSRTAKKVDGMSTSPSGCRIVPTLTRMTVRSI